MRAWPKSNASTEEAKEGTPGIVTYDANENGGKGEITAERAPWFASFAPCVPCF